jgi:hypothetical protein
MTDPRLEAIRLAAQAELAKTPRARPWWVDALLLVALNVGVGVALVLLFPNRGEQHRSELLRWLGAAALLAIALGGAIAAVRPGAQALRVAMLAVVASAVAVLLLGASGASQPALWGGGACGLFETVASVIPVVATTVVLSRFAADAWRTVVGGLAAGTGGLLGLHFTCPIGTLSHIMPFHLVPWLLVCLAALGLRHFVRSATFAP